MSIADKLTAIAENEQKVYNAGYKKGKAEGGGGDNFMESYQQSGTRTNCNYMFYGDVWTEELLKPLYDITPISVERMFARNPIADLKSHFKNLNIALDLSSITSSVNFNYMLEGSSSETFPDIVLSPKLTKISNILRAATNLKTVCIKGITENLVFDAFFHTCYSLEDLILEGTIGQNGFSVQWSTKLSKASITNIINVLSANTTGLTVTLSKTAVNKAFETSEGANDGITSNEWTTLIATKSNWTISLV